MLVIIQHDIHNNDTDTTNTTYIGSSGMWCFRMWCLIIIVRKI